MHARSKCSQQHPGGATVIFIYYHLDGCLSRQRSSQRQHSQGRVSGTNLNRVVREDKGERDRLKELLPQVLRERENDMRGPICQCRVGLARTVAHKLGNK